MDGLLSKTASMTKISFMSVLVALYTPVLAYLDNEGDESKIITVVHIVPHASYLCDAVSSSLP